MLFSVSPAGRYTSDDLRIGDPVGTPQPERPWIAVDAAGNRFYKLFSRFANTGSVPALVTAPVTVAFSYKATSDPTDISGPWTTVGTYTMKIPSSVAPSGAIFPGFDPLNPNPHIQATAVCWQGAGGTELPQRFMLKAEVAWPLELPAHTADNVAYKYYDLTPPKSADIGLVLDLSGSMLEVQPDSSGLSKLAVAQDRAREFVALVEAGNRLGVYGFATGNLDNSAFPGNYRDPGNMFAAGTFNDTSVIYTPTVISNSMDRSTARTAIQDQVTHGCTPVGQGLLRAKAGFEPAGVRSRSIVLFSDGLQNVAPFVNETPSFPCGGAGSLPLIHAGHTFADQQIKIYSIYFGSTLFWDFSLMDQLRTQTGGDYVYGASTGLELAAAYYSIRNLLDDLLYMEENGRTDGFGPKPPITVHFDSAVGSATVGIAWPVGSQALLTVEGRRQGERDWKTLEGTGTTADRGQTQDAHRVLRFTPGADTTWELRVVQLAPREGQVSYALAVYSDVQAAHLEVTLGSKGFAAGRPLPIFAELRRAGLPIAGAQVTATVRVPSRPASTVVRGYAGRLTTTGAGDAGRISAMAAQVRQLLVEDGKPADLYLYRDVDVTLRDDGQGSDQRAGDGIYSGTLGGEETQVAGDVQVTVKAQGKTPSGFPFERITKLATIASVGPADPGRSEVRIAVGQLRPDGTRLATVTVLPTDRFGNAAFPGTGGAITVRPRAGGGTLVGDLADNLDTTFVHTLLLQPGEEPSVEVTVGGVGIGKLEPKLPQLAFHRRELSFHLGVAEPQGAFAQTVDRGPSFAFDFTYRFDPHFALRTEFGGSLFDPRFEDGDLKLLHLVPYLQYRGARVPWTPYFEAGPGFYHLEGHGSAAGFAAGVGVHRVLSPNWLLDLGLHAHRVGGSLDLSFSQLRVGVLYTY